MVRKMVSEQQVRDCSIDYSAHSSDCFGIFKNLLSFRANRQLLQCHRLSAGNGGYFLLHAEPFCNAVGEERDKTIRRYLDCLRAGAVDDDLGFCNPDSDHPRSDDRDSPRISYLLAGTREHDD